MLQAIYAIGREFSKGRDPWLNIVESPYTDKKDDGKSLYALELHFNLDTGGIEALKDNLFAFEKDAELLKKWACIPLEPANHNAFYVAMDASKIQHLSHSFFGKQDKDTKQFSETGQFLKAIKNVAPEVEQMLLGSVLKKMPVCRDSFLALFTDDKGDLSLKKLSTEFFKAPEGEKKKKETDRIMLAFSSVTCAELGLAKYPMRNLDGYETFIEKKFFSKAPKKVKKATAAAGTKHLCYASGEFADDVQLADFAGRDNLTSLFVKTTMNYATGFQKTAYYQNYQISTEIGKFLEQGSDFLLENLTCNIAGIRHVIIPQFFQQERYPVGSRLKTLKNQGDLLFKLTNLEELENYLASNLEDDIPEIYWLNFIATDISPGKSLKASSLIRDVSKFHFRRLLETFDIVGDLLSPWLGKKYGFNLYSMYRVVPVREKKKEKKNHALTLFAALLEQRPVESSQLFEDFSQFVRCHRFRQFDQKGKHRSFPNIGLNPQIDDPNKQFDYAVKDGVFRYLAFWHSLRQLNLLKENQPVMQEEKKLTAAEIAESEEAFCADLKYSDAQKSMFYLGRVLSAVVYEQSGVKKHKKNALDKLNYNGMDAKALVRLSEDLFEASRHYNITGKIVWGWGKFSALFNPDTWRMGTQEALFFILSGYTWGIKTKKGEEAGLSEIEGENELSDND